MPATGDGKPATAARARLIGAMYAVGALVSLMIFFRHLIVYRLDRISGDIGDSRVVMVLLEHWREFSMGQVAWKSPIVLYPSPNFLANTDAYLAYAPLFAVFRSLGLDIYLSFEFTLIAVKAIGFASMAWMLRAVLALPHWAAILGPVLFTIFASSYGHFQHSQLLSIAFVPLIVVGLVNFFANLKSRPLVALCYGALAATMLPLVLMTAFYIGWFFVLFAVCCLVVFLVYYGAQAARSAPTLLRLLARRIGVVLAVGCVFLTSLAPFLVLYLPKLSESGGHSYGALVVNSPNLFDIFHLDSSNLVWGAAMQRFFTAVYIGRPINGEIVTGMTPLLLIVFAVTLIKTMQNSRGVPMESRDLRTHFVIVAGLSTIILWFMSVRVDGLSLWWLIYRFFPGGSAMRVPGRLPIFLATFIIPIAMTGLVWLSETITRRKAFIGGAMAALLIAAALAGALAIEQIDLRNPAAISRAEEHRILDRVQAPPSACRMFYVSRPAPRAESWALLRDRYGPNFDAAIIAQRYDIPTFNGMSTFEPKGWDLSEPGAAGYEQAVQNWIEINHLGAGVCALDLSTALWSQR